MISKSEGMEWDPHYTGYFLCFNRGQYYEAHDVLEELWLSLGRSGPNHGFHKGLIQLAGAFVHLQKGRPGPAVALFTLADTNLASYPRQHDGLDLGAIRLLIADWRAGVGTVADDGNPLKCRPAPLLDLPCRLRRGEKK